MSLAYPWVLLAWLVIPLMIWMYQRRRQQAAIVYSDTDLLASARQLAAVRWKQHLPFALRLLAISLLILASARPQLGQTRLQKSSEGLDIVLAVDTSGSMKAIMDTDLSGSMRNRLEVVKEVITEFIGKRPSDRIGLVVFGTESFTQAPLTLDHQVLLQFLRAVNIGMAGENTAVGNAIATGVKRLKNLESASKVMVLLTDGENTAGEVQPLVAAEAAATLGIKIYTVGVGSNEAVPVPVQSWGGTVYRKRQLKLDVELLEKIASMTGGKFFLASDTEQLQEIYSTIDQLETTTVELEEFHDYQEKALPFLIAALLIWGLEILIGLSAWRTIP